MKEKKINEFKIRRNRVKKKLIATTRSQRNGLTIFKLPFD